MANRTYLIQMMVVAIPLATASPQAATFSSCTVNGLSGDVQCGTVSVAENPARPGSRQVALRVVVARATGSNRSPDPFLLLAGGPGQAASEMGPFATSAFSGVREHRDLVMIDARGTGKSNSLACALMRKPEDLVGATLYPSASVAFCRDSLSRIADLSQYTTARIADDIESVRTALGYPALNLYGTSYGSRLALEFLRRHPASVRSIVLKAVAPPTLIAPANYAQDADAAFRLLERDCLAQPECARAFPNVRADLDSILARAGRGELRTNVPGAGEPLPVSRDAISTTLMGALQSSSSRSQLPLVLHTAASGNAQPMLSLVVQTRRQLDAALSAGMHLSVLCAEDAQRLNLERSSQESAGTFLGTSRVRMTLDACREWRVPGAPAAPFTAVSGSAPVLLVSGEIDPNTPPRLGEEAVRTLPNGRHVVLMGVAHGWSNVENCGAEFVAEFVDKASAKALDLGCSATSSAPPFVIPPAARTP